MKLYIFLLSCDITDAVGPTLCSGWYYRGLNVAVGPTFESFKKSGALRQRFANRFFFMTFQNCLNVHVLINISNVYIFILFYHHGLNVAVGPTVGQR